MRVEPKFLCSFSLVGTLFLQLVHTHPRPIPRFRIINGGVAVPHSHPYQVGIYVTGKEQSQFCGGSLISNNYVLTAAHCVADVQAESMDLIFGAHNVTDNSEETQVRRTSTEFNVHPDWNWSLKQGDVALVKLSEPVAENEYIKIIRLHSGNETYAGEQGMLAGWGITSNNQRTVTPLLHEVAMTIMSNEECAAVSASYKAFMKPNLLCTSGLEHGVKVGFCKGDSGGPLVVGKDADSWLQVGIVSFGQTNCETGLPAVFERVTKYLEWVEKNSDVLTN